MASIANNKQLSASTPPHKAPAKKIIAHAILLALALSITAPLAGPLAAQQRSPEHQTYCLKLESELARIIQGRGTKGIDRSKIASQARKMEGVFARLNNEAERRNCYSYFLFSKELRRTPRCLRIDKKIRNAKRELGRLNDQLHNSERQNSGNRARQDQLIRSLASNKCGAQYQREARKNSSLDNWFGDAFFGGNRRERSYSKDDQFKFATHRTLCVRLCDGYYFPVSFATTLNRFSTDENICQSRCAAPARLYSHPNPGGEAEQMIANDGAPYSDLKNAWRFKKEFVKGCSCKLAEYDPLLLETKTKPFLDPYTGKQLELKQPEQKQTDADNKAAGDDEAKKLTAKLPEETATKQKNNQN